MNSKQKGESGKIPKKWRKWYFSKNLTAAQAHVAVPWIRPSKVTANQWNSEFSICYTTAYVAYHLFKPISLKITDRFNSILSFWRSFNFFSFITLSSSSDLLLWLNIFLDGLLFFDNCLTIDKYRLFLTHRFKFFLILLYSAVYLPNLWRQNSKFLC